LTGEVVRAHPDDLRESFAELLPGQHGVQNGANSRLAVLLHQIGEGVMRSRIDHIALGLVEIFGPADGVLIGMAFEESG